MIWTAADPFIPDSYGLSIGTIPDASRQYVQCQGADHVSLVANMGQDTVWTLDGRSLLWMETEGREIRRCELYTGMVETVLQANYSILRIILSPDSRTLVYAVSPPLERGDDLFALDLDSRETTQLTQGFQTYPVAWTFDGKYVLFIDASSGSDAWHAVSFPEGQVNRIADPPCHILAACPVAMSLRDLGAHR